MHEYSLVRSLLKQVADIVSRNGGGQVEAVRVEVGTFAGVETELLQLAFQSLAPEVLSPQVKLLAIAVDLQAECEECGTVSVIEAFQFRCRICGCDRIRFLAGEDVRLIDIVVTDSSCSEEIKT